MGASWPSWRSWEGAVQMFSELVARNSRRSRRENGLFFTSLLISIVAFYIILSLSHQDVMVFLQRMESSAVDRLLTLVSVLYGLTLFILFFLVYYANRFQLARRRHEFGVYLMLGMQRRKLFGMLLAEDLRSSLIALAIGLPAALLISEVISLVTARLVGLGIVGHRFTLSLSAIGWTAVGFLAIKLLASLILSGKIVREEIGALLTETPEGTKKQRPAAVYAAALVLGGARRDYRFERLALRSCIDEVLDDYRPLLEEKHFRVELRLADETVFSDRRGLCFLLGQVVSNSVKYALDAPVLIFSLENGGTATVLSIRDNGPGVRACDLPYVFEKGFTGDSGHEKNKATGMGLYLAREIAKDLGLTLTAASDWGAGFEVRVTFPVVEE